MLTKEGCQARQQRLWDSVPDHVEWLLVADPRHLQYLVNFQVQPLSFSGGERGLLLLERENGSTLIADNFAARSATHEPYVDREEIETWYDHRHSVINRDHALLKALGRVSEKLYGRSGAVEAEWLPLGAFEVLGLDHEAHSTTLEASDQSDPKGSVDLGTTLRKLRRSKLPDEVELLKQCMRAGDAGHARAREFVKPGVTELEVYREVQSAAVGGAGRAALVYGDFRALNAANPKAGGLPTDYSLKEGDIFVLDYSVVLDGYRSDFTNGYAVGEPTADQVRLFEACAAAMAGGEGALVAGAKAADVYAATSAPLEAAGFGPLSHHAGHGLGLGHPESPILVPESTDTLVAGDVVTIEPGAYVEGIGGLRIEHNYLITDAGYERLSNHEISLT